MEVSPVLFVSLAVDIHCKSTFSCKHIFGWVDPGLTSLNHNVNESEIEIQNQILWTYGIQGHPLKDPVESENDSESVKDYESCSKTE